MQSSERVQSTDAECCISTDSRQLYPFRVVKVGEQQGINAGHNLMHIVLNTRIKEPDDTTYGPKPESTTTTVDSGSLMCSMHFPFIRSGDSEHGE